MFSRFFIERPIFATVVSIVIVILGVISIPTLPVESMPDITPPTVQVSTTFPGANAEVVEQSVATPLEQKVNGNKNLSDEEYLVTGVYGTAFQAFEGSFDRGRQWLIEVRKDF